MTEAVEAVALEAMVDPEVVQQIRGLRAQGWGAKRIARKLGIARNTVKRYVRGSAAAGSRRRWRCAPSVAVVRGSCASRAPPGSAAQRPSTWAPT
jgi:IS30 family transposase